MKNGNVLIIVVIVLIVSLIVGYAYVCNTKNSDFVITYKDEEYNVGTIKNKRNLPIIESNVNKEAANEIEKALTEISNVQWNDIKEQTEQLKDTQLEGIGAAYILSTVKQTSLYVSFIGNLSGGFGGVSWDDVDAFAFNAKTGKRLKIEDISDRPEEFKKFCIDYVIDYIQNNIDKNDLFDDWKETVNKTIFNSFILSDKGLEIYFQRYSVGPGALGTVQVIIPYSKINKYLNKDYRNV